MPLSVAQLTSRLTASGLLSAEDVQKFIAQLPAEKQPRDGQDLARELVRRKWLTEYQAREVFHGRTKGLVYGEYRILEQVATGGMGQVFKAQHQRMERVVALKVLKESLLESAEAVQRFEREVRAAARLDHPNIVSAFDAGEVAGEHYLVLQFVDGPNLKSLIRDNGPLSVAAALDYTVQAALALEYAHAQGVLHRDVKPANLLVDRKGMVKVLDMGLARIEDELREEHRSRSEPGRLTVGNQMLGTADYMAPEQAEDTRSADARSDQYALGCTMYFLLVGRPPYPGDTVAQTLQQHLGAAIPSLQVVRKDVPASVEAAYRRMMAKRPEERFATMTEVIEALAATGVAEVNSLAVRSSRPSAVAVEAADPAPGRRSGSHFNVGLSGEGPIPERISAGSSSVQISSGTSVSPTGGSTAAGDESRGGSGGSSASPNEETVVYFDKPEVAAGGSSAAAPPEGAGESGWWRRMLRKLRK
jgi:serine/threonine protein kinase